MRRYFFHFHQDEEFSIDTEGCAFRDVEAAYLGAVDAAREMMPDILKRREDPLICAFEVEDEDGNALFTFPFSELLDCCNTLWQRHEPARPHIFVELIAVSRRASKALTDVSNSMNEARATLRETIDLLRGLSRATEQWQHVAHALQPQENVNRAQGGGGRMPGTTSALASTR